MWKDLSSSLTAPLLFLEHFCLSYLQDIYLPLHVQESEDFAVDIFGFPLAIFAKVIFIFSRISWYIVYMFIRS